MQAFLGRRRQIRITRKPVLHDIVVKLFRPQQPRVGLTDDVASLGRETACILRFVERRRLSDPRRENLLEVREGFHRPVFGRGQAEAQHHFSARGNFEHVMRRRLRPNAVRIHGLGASLHDRLMERILHVRRKIRRSEEPLVVRLVLGEKPRRLRVDCEPEIAERLVLQSQQMLVELGNTRLQRAALVLATPDPRVAKPHRREHVQPRRFRPAVGERQADEHVVRIGLGILRDDIEVASVVEDTRILDFEFRLQARAPRVPLDQLRIGKLRLRILVERPHIGMRRRRIEIVPDLFRIFAVIALRIRKPENPLLQNGIALIPQRHRKAQPALAVADPEQPILAPAIGAAARVIVGKVIPGIATRRIILAHRPPLPLREIRPPALPVLHAPGIFLEAEMFGCRVGGHGTQA